MSETRTKARALLADVATEGTDIPCTLDLLAALCDENDALEQERGLAIGQRHAAIANLAERDAQLSRQNAGLVQMARDRDRARAEVERLRVEIAKEAALRAELAAEVKRLKAAPAALCVCVGATYGFDPGRNVIGQRVGYSITAGVGCPACGGRGVVAAMKALKGAT